MTRRLEDMHPAFIEEMDSMILRYGSERDALNVALAKLQEARAWIIAQEKCPNCHEDLNPEEERNEDGSIGFYYLCPNGFYYLCPNCGKAWSYIGLEIKTE